MDVSLKTVIISILAVVMSLAAAQNSAAQQAARKIGVIKSINGNTIVLTPDSGADINVTVAAAATFKRIAPGEKNLQNAVVIQLTDLQPGDRIRAAGVLSADGNTLTASSIVAIRKADVEAHQQQDLQDWQKRGTAGLVTEVDAATGTVTLTVTGFSGTKKIAVHTTPKTIIRRYAPGSIQFSDAKASTFAEIKTGDQLRARGDRNADGTEYVAEEIVGGTFTSISGLIQSVDASAGAISVQDLVTKKTLQLKVGADSQMHQLPAEMAQHMAARLKGGAPGAGQNGAAGQSANQANATQPGAQARNNGGQNPAPQNSAGPPQGRSWNGGAGGGTARQGAPDLQQMLSRTPTVAVADLKKGQAVLVLATETTPTTTGSIITLVSGVEPILQAAPNANSATMLSPWNLGGGGGEGSE